MSKRFKCVKRGCKNDCVTVENGEPLCADHCEGWLTRNLQDPEFAAAYQRECDADAPLAALKAAVVEAVMSAYNCGLYTLPTNVDAACAALAKEEADHA